MDVIISVRPEYVQRIAARTKTIELRTKRPNLIAGDIIWIYETLPRGHVTIRASVENVDTLGFMAAWKKHKSQMDVTYKEYIDYLNGQDRISLIFFKSIRVLQTPISLEQLRKTTANFSPPQFMRKVTEPILLRKLAQGV